MGENARMDIFTAKQDIFCAFLRIEDIFLLSEKYYSYCVNQTHICYIEYSK